MKKLLFLLLATILPAMAGAYDAKINGIYYNFDKTAKTAMVTYYRSDSNNQNAYSGTVNIPTNVVYSGETYDVTSIGEWAFRYCSGLTSVTIPNSVTSIGGCAFENCCGLTSVTIPNSVMSIGSSTFSGCSSLTNVMIPNSVTSIGDSAFNGCSGLTSVTIPNSVTSIGSFAFRNCNSLTSVTISNSVTILKCGTFYGCSSLTTMSVPNSVTNIEDGYYNGFVYGVFQKCSSLTSVTIPNSVTFIGSSAFTSCSGLTTVTIPNSVTSIGGSAFSGCSGLNSVTIPNSVTNIGDYAFAKCSVLTSVTIGNGITTINENTFENCSRIENLILPEQLSFIRSSAFKGCRGLKSVTIPASVEFIYQEAFANCTGLESVKALPETPPFLYDNSFSNYNIPLFASKTAIGAYQAKDPWSKFAQFLTLEGQEVEMPQCTTPTIDYANWKLTFSCATKGAEIVSKAKVQEEKEGGSELSLTPTYTITAYAKAEGYRDSEEVTATIGWKNGRPVIIQGFSNVSLSDYAPNCDTNLDGTIDVADIGTIIDAMAAQAREQKDMEE